MGVGIFLVIGSEEEKEKLLEEASRGSEKYKKKMAEEEKKIDWTKRGKNARKKWRRRVMKRVALLADPFFDSWLLSGKQWRHMLNPSEFKKRKKKKKKKKAKMGKKKWIKYKRWIKKNEKKWRQEKKEENEEKWRKKKEEEKEKRRMDLEEKGFSLPPLRERPGPKIRLERFRNHQKAVTKVKNTLLQKAREIYAKCFPSRKTLPPIRLMWGDAKFPHTGHGHPPCPNKGLRERLEPFFDGEIIMASELCTTQSSPCCCSRIPDRSIYIETGVLFIDDPRHVCGNIYFFCSCYCCFISPNFLLIFFFRSSFNIITQSKNKNGKSRAIRCSRCKRPWNRDIGATRNIFKKYFEKREGVDMV